MIARAKTKTPNWQQAFLVMLPAILRHARIAFRHLDNDARQEVVQEVVCNALVVFNRLSELGKSDLAYPSVLARFAVAQVRSDRRVGGKLNARDVLARYAQQKQRFAVERLDRFDPQQESWEEIVVEDKTAGPAEVAATRIDFGSWLDSLTEKQRHAAECLACGETTQKAAKQLGVSSGRVSQLRRELMEAWQAFHERPALACG